jgi:sialate O-acetylesterase
MDHFNLLTLVILAVAFVSLSAVGASAGIRMGALFSDGMVLQREMPIPIWGMASPHDTVVVELDGHSATATADAKGKWLVRLPATSAGGPFVLSVTGKDGASLKISNVYVGEVWLASGQSNMHWTFAPGHSVINNEAELAAARDPLNRQFTVGKIASTKPLDDVTGKWLGASAEELLQGDENGASAAGYFFARGLREKLNVPVGILNSSIGGTPIDRWMPGEDLYNAMIEPLAPYAIRGALWYQGESNLFSGDGLKYAGKQKKLIADWRKRWAQGDFSFYFVQLAPHLYSVVDSKVGADALPIFWEAQTSTLSVPNTGMAVTVDIGGDVADIHPRNKQDVGKRLALWALAKDYGEKDLVYTGPLFKKHTVQGNKIQLAFDHAAGLTGRDNKPLTGFTIAGKDGQFVPAEATVEGKAVVVRAEQVDHPVAVRYDWSENPDGNLVNAAGLPASPFRTDKQVKD